MMPRYVFRLATVFLVSITMLACTTVHDDFKPYTPIQTQLEKAPLKVAVVLPEELCSFYFDNGNLTAFALGPVICQSARNVAQRAFSNPLFYDNADQISPGEVNAIATLRPVRAWAYSIPRPMPARFITTMDLSWEFRTVPGEGHYRATVYGAGLDRRTFGLADARYESSMQRCMDDLATNLYQEMATAFEKVGKNVKTSGRIRAAVETYQVGVTTYAQHRAERTDDWHLYALDEGVKYDGGKYRYLIDPMSDQHVSALGSWKTRWSSRRPDMESLRPSVYLPESKVDDPKISDVYIKELVGSVYDDHPLCELVFEGNNFETAVLTRRSCQQDYAAIEAYTSKDIYHERTLSETGQQWLKLRVGMSQQEVVTLIGSPPRRSYDTLRNASTFEYGYGRVRFYGQEGLSYWQLSD